MSDTNLTIRTRMAPSPTGEYHIGHIRTILYNYALAKQNNGQFIIRIEDTDQKRFVPGAQERILQVIKDYGLSWDEGPDIGGPYAPYVQTQRLPVYQKYIQKLIDNGGAYYCFCTAERLEEMRQLQKAAGKIPKYDRHCLNLTREEIDKNIKSKMPYVIRLRIPDNTTFIVHDLVRGEIKFKSQDVDDQILVKSDGIPTYHFAAGIDDHLMNITHILRGDEWISSLPKQATIYKYLGWDLPNFAHLPVLLDPSGHGKMSKRRGSVSARSFLDNGYLPEALLNFLMLLGWNPGTDREIYSLDDFVKEFNVAHLHKKQPVFDVAKLNFFNGYYIRQKTDRQLAGLLKPFIPEASEEFLLKIIPFIKERITTLKDAVALTGFFFKDIDYDKSLLLTKVDKNTAKNMLMKSEVLLKSETDWTLQSLQPKLMELIAANSWKVGDFFMVFRVAVAGVTQTPPIVDCLPILGKDATIRKINFALSKI